MLGKNTRPTKEKQMLKLRLAKKGIQNPGLSFTTLEKIDELRILL